MTQDYASSRGREPPKSKLTAWGEEKGKGGFSSLPHTLTRSKAFASLDPYETKMIIDLISQYNGTNNGTFVMCFDSLMKGRGWRSKTTINKTRMSLLKKGFIFQTRKGWKGTPSLYAVTFYRMDEGKGHTFPAAKMPTHEWLEVSEIKNTVREVDRKRGI